MDIQKRDIVLIASTLTVVFLINFVIDFSCARKIDLEICSNGVIEIKNYPVNIEVDYSKNESVLLGVVRGDAAILGVQISLDGNVETLFWHESNEGIKYSTIDKNSDGVPERMLIKDRSSGQTSIKVFDKIVWRDFFDEKNKE